MSALQQMLAAASIKNYATLDPANKGTNVTLSGGNLSISVPSFLSGSVISTISKSSGKWYWEVTSTSSNGVHVGVFDSNANLSSAPGAGSNGWAYYYSGSKYHSASSVAYGSIFGTGDVIGVALDMDAGTLIFYKNNVSQGTAYTGLTGSMYAVVGTDSSSPSAKTATANFGATAFTYSPPSGYNAGLYS